VPVRAVGGVEAFSAGGLALVWDGAGWVVVDPRTVAYDALSGGLAVFAPSFGFGVGIQFPSPVVTSGSAGITAPTWVGDFEGTPAGVSAGGTITVNVTANAGDLVLLVVSAENGTQTTSYAATATGQTWTSLGTTGFGLGTESAAQVWSTTWAATGTLTVTVTRTASGNTPQHALQAHVWRDHDGTGAVAIDNDAGTAPSLDVTTTSDNSGVSTFVDDFNAADGASRTWRTINSSAMTETYYLRNAAAHTVYGGYRANAGTAGVKTTGLSAPTGQRPAVISVEVKGLAGAGGDATATPPVGDTTIDIPAPTVSSGATVTGTVAGVALDLPAPTVAAGTGATATPGVLDVAADFPAPSVSSGGAATATPGVLDVTLDLPAPTVTAARSATATPGVVDVGVSTPAPAADAGVTASPAVADVTIAIPTALVDSTVIPDAADVALDFPAPTVTSSGGATATPGVLDVAASLPAPTVSATSGATATPAVADVTADLPAPSVSAGGAATATPAVLSLSVDVVAATAASGAGVAAAVLDVAASFPAPTVTAASSASASPGPVDITISFPAPAVDSGGTPLFVTTTAGGSTWTVVGAVSQWDTGTSWSSWASYIRER
jgi:hypothetical protein